MPPKKKEPVAEPVVVAPPLPPPPLVLRSKEEQKLDRIKAVAALKKAWAAMEEEIRADVAAAADAKKAYEEARSGLGQEEVDFARSTGWIGSI